MDSIVKLHRIRIAKATILPLLLCGRVEGSLADTLQVAQAQSPRSYGRTTYTRLVTRHPTVVAYYLQSE